MKTAACSRGKVGGSDSTPWFAHLIWCVGWRYHICVLSCVAVAATVLASADAAPLRMYVSRKPRMLADMR